ncbi:DUF4124 domain-containing protein [Pseudomaricurvus sp.]|uniref:DUF4124 domain-containing protein n=1 Tax=Pseudomaricurvus sp. TaxID=2004510 RepID=UPI003F6D3D0C
MNTRLLRRWTSAGLISVTLTLCAAPSALAAKLYKVVDADGNITFSQFPPAEKTDKHEIESVKVDAGGEVKTPVTTIGNTQYCGDISLPVAQVGSHGSTRFLKNVARQKKNWERSLERLEAQVERDNLRQFKQNSSRYYGNTSYRNQRNLEYQKRKDANLQSLKELRCAMDWAAEQQNGMETLAANNAAEIKRLQQVHNNLQGALQNNCGAEPVYDPSDPALKHQRKEWRKCAGEYLSDMRSVERELSNASRNIQSTR